MKIVAVIADHKHVHRDAEEFGTWLAGFDVHLLTGGGGGMEAVCKGFTQVLRPKRRGWSIGVLPADLTGRSLKQGYPNSFVEIAIKTHLHGQKNADGSGGNESTGIYSRNRINALTADLMVAFPGGPGTSAEVSLALDGKTRVYALVEAGQSIGGHNAEALKSREVVVLPRLSDQAAIEGQLQD